MKTTIQWYLCIGTCVLTFNAAHAALYSMGGVGVTGPSSATALPDNDATGAAWNFSFNDASLSSISSVSVAFNISGGYNGDLYAYLSHGSGFAVLLNHIGASASNPDGSPGSGFNVVLQPGSYTDIHSAAVGSPVTGTFSADGRINYVDTLRNNTLNVFNNLNPNGSWTLFFADRAGGSISTVNGWSVDIEGISTVPEPVNVALGLFGTMFACITGVRLFLKRMPINSAASF